MVCVGIYVTLFANLLLRLHESSICHLWSLPHLLHEIKKKPFFFYSSLSAFPTGKLTLYATVLYKRSSSLKYSFISLLFWLALQKHILDHYCTTKLLFGKGYTQKKLYTKSPSWKHLSIPHLCEKDCTCLLYFYLPPQEYNPYSDLSLLYVLILPVN